MLQFSDAKSGWVSVRIEGRKVGDIRPSRGGGFHYQPLNSKLRGETMRTIDAVKASVAGKE